MKEELLEKIHERCPCRKGVINTLLKYIIPEDSRHTVNSLFVYGNTGSGKTFVLKTILDTLEVILLLQ